MLWNINKYHSVSVTLQRSLKPHYYVLIVFPIGTCLLSEGWNNSFWHEIGLGDLVEGNYTKIGTHVNQSKLGSLTGSCSPMLGGLLAWVAGYMEAGLNH